MASCYMTPKSAPQMLRVLDRSRRQIRGKEEISAKGRTTKDGNASRGVSAIETRDIHYSVAGLPTKGIFEGVLPSLFYNYTIAAIILNLFRIPFPRKAILTPDQAIIMVAFRLNFCTFSKSKLVNETGTGGV
jgi:hypothetical protein